jgi:hypothetical protein
MMNAAAEAGGGNAGGWKGWKNDGTVFPPFPPTLEIDQTDFHIPTVTTTTRMNNPLKLARYGIRILRARLVYCDPERA